MRRVLSVAAMLSLREEARSQNLTVGFVPTMGALHAGHGALIAEAAKRHDVVVVSVFVNPTQFGPNEDFERYPRNLELDEATIASYGGTVMFAPSVAEMYPDGPAATIDVGVIGTVLEGRHRPGHFNGVATVVKRLFDIVQADAAYFGAKDFQQTLVVKAMVAQQELPTQVVVLPTIREHDGLAMSSRNVYLSADARHHATVLYRALCEARNAIEAGERSPTVIEQKMADVLSTVRDAEVDYAVVRDSASLSVIDRLTSGNSVVCLIAAKLGTTRLIDNDVMQIP